MGSENGASLKLLAEMQADYEKEWRKFTDEMAPRIFQAEMEVRRLHKQSEEGLAAINDSFEVVVKAPAIHPREIAEACWAKYEAAASGPVVETDALRATARKTYEKEVRDAMLVAYMEREGNKNKVIEYAAAKYARFRDDDPPQARRMAFLVARASGTTLVDTLRQLDTRWRRRTKD